MTGSTFKYTKRSQTSNDHALDSESEHKVLPTSPPIVNSDEKYHENGKYLTRDATDGSVEVEELRMKIQKISIDRDAQPIVSHETAYENRSSLVVKQRKTSDLPRGITTHIWDEYIRRNDDYHRFESLFLKFKREEEEARIKKELYVPKSESESGHD